MNKQKSLIELKNVSKTFEDNGISNVIFENLNFSINQKETISVCGSSGSGKTTLLNLITLLEYQNHGEIFWNSQNTADLSQDLIAKKRNKMFGYIFQGCNLIPELTVIENILFPLKIFGKITKSKREFAKNLLNTIGLFDKYNNQINMMSGGERQRIAIVRAMILEPALIIADEPTGNLDKKNSDIVIQIILDLCEKHNSSLLLITHNEKLANTMQYKYNIEQKNLILTKNTSI